MQQERAIRYGEPMTQVRFQSHNGVSAPGLCDSCNICTRIYTGNHTMPETTCIYHDMHVKEGKTWLNNPARFG